MKLHYDGHTDEIILEGFRFNPKAVLDMLRHLRMAPPGTEYLVTASKPIDGPLFDGAPVRELHIEELQGARSDSAD